MSENSFENDFEYNKIDQLYNECLDYLDSLKCNVACGIRNFIHDKKLKNSEELYNKLEENVVTDENALDEEIYSDNEVEITEINAEDEFIDDETENPYYEAINDAAKEDNVKSTNAENTETTSATDFKPKTPVFRIENEVNLLKSSSQNDLKSERLRRLSQQLPKIIITQSQTTLNDFKGDGNLNLNPKLSHSFPNIKKKSGTKIPSCRYRSPYRDYPRRLVCKDGSENVAVISNVPFEKIRMLNDTFHTLINLRWRWIVTGTVVTHFAIWFVFAVFWYIASYAHYDFEPDPPQKACITGGTDFATIFLASVEAQTTIGFGDRTIDEECPESIFLFVMQLILGTGLSGVLTCVVYAKLTRPEKLSKDGVGFSKKAVVCIRDGKLCVMVRVWDLNYDHIISSEVTAHYVKTYRTKEGETIRYYASSLAMQQRQFLLWPVTLVHEIDKRSPFYKMGPDDFMTDNYEITVCLKGASASMGTFTQSQTSYLPTEIKWGYRFPSVVSYNHRKRKYVIDDKKLNEMIQIDTPLCSAKKLYKSMKEKSNANSPLRPNTPSSFSAKLNSFKLERASSFRLKHDK